MTDEPRVHRRSNSPANPRFHPIFLLLSTSLECQYTLSAFVSIVSLKGFLISDLPPPILKTRGFAPDYPTTLTSPSQSSPRSISSVKRKPVPRHSIRLEFNQNALGGPSASPPFLFQRRRVESHPEMPPRSTSFASSASTPDDDALPCLRNCPQTPLSECGTSQQIQAPSPLTVEEMDGIQSFARENEGSFETHKRRRRRGDLRSRRQRTNSYHMHTAIVDSYFDGSDEDFRPTASDRTSSIWDDAPISITSSRDFSLRDCAGVEVLDGRGEFGPYRQSSEQQQLVVEGNVVTPLRVNRATFGVYDTPLGSPAAKSPSASRDYYAGKADTSLLEDVVNDVNDTIEIFQHSGGSYGSADGDNDDDDVPDLSKMARRGGLHAKDDNLVSHLVNSTRPTLALSSSPELTEYQFEARAPSPHFEALLSSRRDDESTSSYSTPDIGVAILSKEDLARLEYEFGNEEVLPASKFSFDSEYEYRNEVVQPVSKFSFSSESDHYHVDEEEYDNENGSDACDEPSLISPLTDDMPTTPSPDFELCDLKSSYHRMTSSISKLRATHSPTRGSSVSVRMVGEDDDLNYVLDRGLGASTSSSLKPALALRINSSGFHSISTASSPSPPTPCSSLPPHSPGFVVPGDWGMSPRSPTYSTFPSTTTRSLHTHGKAGPGGISYTYGTPAVPASFFQMTPNEPASNKRGRLRSFFSRGGAKK